MTIHVLLNEELRRLNATRANHEEGGSEVLLVEVAPVGHRERLVRDGVVDRPPDVDDAHARLEQAVGVLGKVVLDAGDAGIVGLVDVHALLWTAMGG